MQRNPLPIFKEWQTDAAALQGWFAASVCCLSTTGLDGFPNARFVSLKETVEEGFVVTGPLQSRKGLEIAANNKVALSFWWSGAGRQVRVQGEASSLLREVAVRYFHERPLEAQVVSLISKQGLPWPAEKELETELAAYQQQSLSPLLECPNDWGGFVIRPVRMEFMQFRENRLHQRTLFQKQHNGWMMTRLQP